MQKIDMVEVKKLKLAHFNPSTRCNSIGSMVESIKEIGLLSPILVTKAMDVVDGHRRIASYKKLGLTEIPAILVTGDQAVLYSQVNGCAKKFSGNEALECYLKEPNALPPKSRAHHLEAEENLGRALLNRICKEGGSIATYKGAKQLAKLVDKVTPEVLTKIVKWMLHFNCQSICQKAIRAGTSPGLIIAAVERFKPIRPRFDVAK